MVDWVSYRVGDWKNSTLGERAFIGVLVVIVVLIVVGVAALVYNARDVSGTVVNKDFTPAHYVTETQCAPNVGGSGGCSVVVTQRYVGDSWVVIVSPDDGSSNVTRSVAESYWNQVSIGDRWTDSSS